MKLSSTELQEYRAVQALARGVLEALERFIVPGVSEEEIAQHGDNLLREAGADSFWYWEIGSFVLVGPRTVLSMSGSDYRATSAVAQNGDLVTVDVSPQKNGVWGDCARSYVAGDGGSVADLRSGIQYVESLHHHLNEIVHSDLRFGELFQLVNAKISESSYENLDFKSNLGHTIEKSMQERIYIEAGSDVKVSDVALFTFEPHVRPLAGAFGFKKEDVYFFADRKLQRL